MSNVDVSPIVEKIAKLLKKAESAREVGSLKEAELFAGKVNELLVKHNLEMSQVESIDLSSDRVLDTLDDLKINLEYGKNSIEGLWEIDLAGAIARYNFTKVLFRGSRHKSAFTGTIFYPKINFIGRKDNVEISIYLFEFLRNAFSELAASGYKEEFDATREKFAWWSEGEDKDLAFQKIRIGGRLLMLPPGFSSITKSDIVCDYSTPAVKENGLRKYMLKDPAKAGLMSSKSVWIKSFLQGAVRGLVAKFESEKEKLSSEVQEQVTSLVRVEEVKIDKFIKEKYKKLGRVSSNQGAGRDTGALIKGEKAGKSIQIGKAVKSSNHIKQLGS